MIRRVLRGQRGFLLLNVVFLTVIVSFGAIILINAAPRVRNPKSTLELTARHLANEQLAYLESQAAINGTIDSNFKISDEDRITKNAGDGREIIFTVDTEINGVEGSENLRTATVTVSWIFDGKNFSIDAERTILIVRQTQQ